MQYKTIVLELLKERTELHEQLRLTRRLLPTMESCARELKASHETWMETLAQANPGSELLPWLEREFTLYAMKATKGNQVRAAKLLGITRATLRKRIERFGITRELTIS